MNIGKEIIKIENGVTDNLPGTMIGNIATTIGFKVGGFFFTKSIVIYQ